jgi:kynurenine formamidase
MCVPGCQEAVRAALSRRGFFKGAAAAGFAAAAVAPEQAHAALLPPPARRFRNAVDLTHTLSPDFPTFFGEPGIALEKKFDFKKDGFNLYWWRLLEHAGTHLDAPIHFSEAGASAEQIPAATLVVPLAVVDVVAKAAQNPDYLVTREDLVQWERRNRRLPENGCVAMHSGWARHLSDRHLGDKGVAARYTGKDAAGVFHFPGFGPDAVAWLMKERKVAGLAVDTLSLDHGPSKDFKVHRAWLPSGRWGLENVANLDRMPAAGATLVVGLAKVKDATGGPARLLALV